MSTRTAWGDALHSPIRATVWVLVGFAILAAAAAFMATANSHDAAPSAARQRNEIVGKNTADTNGTAGGQVELGRRSAAAAVFVPHAGVVTGTGPGLVQVAAAQSRVAAGGAAVTGTGPGLEVIARRAWAIRLRVGGTGPDLRRIAGW